MKTKGKLAEIASSFDFIVSTIPEKHEVNPFIPLLARDCVFVLVGALGLLVSFGSQLLTFQCKSLVGSLIDNLADTQVMFGFCTEHQMGPDIKVIAIRDINSTSSSHTLDDWQNHAHMQLLHAGETRKMQAC